VDLTLEQMQQCLSDSGCCICGQTATLVPADRIMYATRDITGTVDNANFVTGKKAMED
jgi:thymidine phosphorylase